MKKLKALLFVFCLIGTCFFVGSEHAKASVNRGNNLSALVEIEALQAKEFAEIFALFSSMPLTGKVISRGRHIALVRVSVLDETNFTGFDVGRFILNLNKEGRWKIKSIRVKVAMAPHSTEAEGLSNVGSIGHGK